jgi:transitional endoplasmic reticulum ATPase
LGATNREDLLDPALMRAGRLDFVLPFPMPDEEARLEILEVHTKDRPLAADVDLMKLARESTGMAGSDLAFICKRATLLAIRDLIGLSQGRRKATLAISTAHFQAAIAEIQGKRKN